MRNKLKLLQLIITGIIKVIIGISIIPHVFAVHSKLLWKISPDKLTDLKVFTFMSTEESIILSYIFASPYSIATAAMLILIKVKTWRQAIMIISFAILDGIGVFFYYNNHITNMEALTALYYSCYTIVIFVIVGSMNFVSESDINIPQMEVIEKTPSTDDREQRVIELIKQGLSQTKIASELGVSQPYVSKTKKKYSL